MDLEHSLRTLEISATIVSMQGTALECVCVHVCSCLCLVALGELLSSPAVQIWEPSPTLPVFVHDHISQTPGSGSKFGS